MIELGPLRLDIISDGLFELKPESFVKITQERNRSLLDGKKFRLRVRVGFNSLLIRGDGRTILIDPGTGDKRRDALAREYRMEWPRQLMPGLVKLGVRPEQIDTMILTHLHWDHAGGATKVDHDGQIVPTFPKARYVVQRRELDFAREGTLTGDDGYIADDFEPLVHAHKLDLIEQDDVNLTPWLSLHWTGGHTPGHQLVKIGNENGQRAMFLGDLVPTTAQLLIESGMSYDSNHAELLAAKKKFLNEAASENYLAIFVHAPRNVAGRIRKVDDSKFEFLTPPSPPR